MCQNPKNTARSANCQGANLLFSSTAEFLKGVVPPKFTAFAQGSLEKPPELWRNSNWLRHHDNAPDQTVLVNF